MNQKLNNLLKDPRTNWKYIWIVVILGILTGTGILGYYSLWIKDLESKIAEIELKLPVKPPEKVIKDETADLSRDEVLRDWKTYRNEKYGFELQYPPTVDLMRKWENDLSIGVYFFWPTPTRESFAFNAQNVLLSRVRAQEDYDVIDYLIGSCAADSPFSSRSCLRPNPSFIQHFENQHGARYNLFYTKVVESDNKIPPNITSQEDIGPFIYIPLDIESEFIIFAPGGPLKEYPENYQEDILGILSTLKPVE